MFPTLLWNILLHFMLHFWGLDMFLGITATLLRVEFAYVFWVVFFFFGSLVFHRLRILCLMCIVLHAGMAWIVWLELLSPGVTLGSIVCFGLVSMTKCHSWYSITPQSVLTAFSVAPSPLFFKWHKHPCQCFLCGSLISMLCMLVSMACKLCIVVLFYWK